MASKPTGTDQPSVSVPFTNIPTDENAKQPSREDSDVSIIQVLRKFSVAEIILGTILVIIAIVTLICSFTHSVDQMQRLSKDKEQCLNTLIWSRICQGIWCGMAAIVTGAYAFDLKRKGSDNRYLMNMVAASFTTVLLIIAVIISVMGVVISYGCFNDLIALLIITAVISSVLLVTTVIHTTYCIHTNVKWRNTNRQKHPQIKRLFEVFLKVGIAEICFGIILVLISIGTLITSNTTYHHISSRLLDNIGLLQFYQNGKNCRSAVTWSRISQGIWCGMAAIITGLFAIECRKSWTENGYLRNLVATTGTAILLITGVILSIKGVYISDGCFVDLFALHIASALNCFVLLTLVLFHAAYCYTFRGSTGVEKYTEQNRKRHGLICCTSGTRSDQRL